MIVVIPSVLTSEELRKLRSVAAQLPFADGKESAGFRAKLVKNNEQVSKEAEGRRELQEVVMRALANSKDFRRTAMPHRIRPPLISRYRTGMSYGVHVDDALMGQPFQRERSDISITVFISDANEYEGGELVIHSPYGVQEVKLPAGYAVTYPSNTLHEVTEVTKGERLVAVTWAQSYVRDEKQRQILSDMFMVREKLHALDPKGHETNLAFHVHSNLIRMWSET